MGNETEKIRILHVDDEEDTLAVVKIILEKEGFEVVSVKRGDKALEKIKINGFSLLILDIMMPDMSGWELFTRISIIKPSYKVIFLSILEIDENKINELKNAGLKDYIRKPFDRVDFITRVKKVLNS